MQNELLELSTPSLRYAVSMCEANPQYRAAVIISAPEEIVRARDIITDYLDMTQYVIPRDKDKIVWKNGSYIRFVYPDDTSRGYHFTLILLSPSLNVKERERARRRWLR